MIESPMTVKDVAQVSRRGVNRVRNAANSGALECLPRETGQRFLFTEAQVAKWIAAGSPEFPPRRFVRKRSA